jgi:putative flavoprotein involved in K+ transport
VGNEVQLQPNAADHVRFGDEASTRLKALIDRFIAENHLDAPAPESDPADLPDINASCVSSMRTLDLERENVRSVIWATGFDGDFSYLKDKVVDGNGRPEHRNGISGLAGLYFVGFPWLRKRKSGIILGIVEDAAIISDNVKRAWSK